MDITESNKENVTCTISSKSHTKQPRFSKLLEACESIYSPNKSAQAKTCQEDFEFAMTLQSEIEDEIKRKVLEEKMGEMEALRIAIEEKRLHMLDNNMKAQKIADDYKYAEVLSKEEENAAQLKDPCKTDICKAIANCESKQVKDGSRISSERKDDHKVTHQTSRESHRERQRKTFKLHPSINSNLAAIGRLWERAEAEVENLDGGIVFTLLLPHLLNLIVHVVPGSKLIEIEATRFVVRSDKTATTKNSKLVTEFVIDGVKKLKPSNVNYEYNSETGLLFVYVDNVSLSKTIAPYNSPVAESKKLFGNSSLPSSVRRLFR